MADTRPTILVISQTYPPDPAAVGQHMHEVAAMLAKRGWRVVSIASDAGYDDPRKKFPSKEAKDGVEVRRLPLSSFGKKSMAIRLLGGCAFTMQAALRAVWTRNVKLVLVSTSPPMAPLAGIVIKTIRQLPGVFWAMDINPDQMIAMARTAPTSVSARLFNAMIRSTLRRFERTVTLDPFMAESLRRKLPPKALEGKLVVIPPWSQDEHVKPIAHADNPFRREHRLEGKRVFMYSGNLSPVHPIDTFLETARRVQDDPVIRFVFIGGGQGKLLVEQYVKEHGLGNVLTLPFQPFEKLSESLSAADVHLVSMGPSMVGIVHPCKVYGAMAVARPFLAVAPDRCHLGAYLQRFDCGWRADHGDADAMERLVREIACLPQDELDRRGANAFRANREELSFQALCGRFCDQIELLARKG
jgi:glycosyltransferase involved in cell wall biosynthesis